MNRRFEGKKVLITGAAGAIGSALAKAFAREGADVCVHYKASREKAMALVEEFKGMGVNAFCVSADVSKPEECLKTVEAAAEGLGGLDIVINNAIYGPQIELLELSLEEVMRTFDTNARGYFLIAQYAARRMVKQGTKRGWIVNISSISSRSMTSTYVHYGATKGAVEAMTRGMAVALAPYGINVNCVAPGTVNTPTVQNMFEDPKNAEPVISRTPQGRIPETEDIIEPVLFFCSEGAGAVTGQVLDVDGGYAIHGMEWNLSQDMVDFRNQLEEKGSDKLEVK